MRTYRVTLGNGKVLGNLTMNADNFVSATKVTESDFADGLDSVLIEYTGDETVTKDEEGNEYPIMHNCVLGTHEHMYLLYCKQIAHEEGYFFVLRDYDEEQLKEMRTESRLDYLEMMIDA